MSIAFLMINVGRRARAAVEERLGERGLSFRHFSALGHLRRDPGLSYSELARRARVSAQSMQSTVGHLLDERLVERGEGAAQGKRAELRLTPLGLELLTYGEAALRAVDDDLTADISDTAQAVLQASLLAMFQSSLGTRS